MLGASAYCVPKAPPPPHKAPATPLGWPRTHTAPQRTPAPSLAPAPRCSCCAMGANPFADHPPKGHGAWNSRAPCSSAGGGRNAPRPIQPETKPMRRIRRSMITAEACQWVSQIFRSETYYHRTLEKKALLLGSFTGILASTTNGFDIRSAAVGRSLGFRLKHKAIN